MAEARTDISPNGTSRKKRGRVGSKGAAEGARAIQYATPALGEQGASLADAAMAFATSGALEDPLKPNTREIDAALQRDPMLQALTIATILPLLFSEGHVEEAEGDSGEAEMVDANLTGPEWDYGMTTPLTMVLEQEASALFYRIAFFEKHWERKPDGEFYYRKLAFRRATECRIRQDMDNGSFNGFHQEGSRPDGRWFREDFDPQKAYVFVHGNAMRPLLGTSLMQAPWHEHMHKNKLRWLQFRGFAKFGNGIIHIQTARTGDDDIEKLENAGNNVLDGGVLVTADDEPVDLLTPGGQAQFLETLREIDSGMARSFLLPQLTLAQGAGQGGAYALAKEHGDLFIMLCESRLNQIAENRTRYLIPPLVYLNRGPNAAYPSWKFPGLTEEGRELAKEIFIAMLGRPQASVHPVIKAQMEKEVARQLGADDELIPEWDAPEREVEQVPAEVVPGEGGGQPVAKLDQQRGAEAAALQASTAALQRETGVAASEVALHLPGKHNQQSHAGKDAPADPLAWAAEEFADWRSSLSEQERDALVSYGRGGFDDANRYHRGDVSLSETEEAKAKELTPLLDAAIAKHATTAPVVAHRRIVEGAAETVIAEGDSLVGGELEYAGYTSTTLNENYTSSYAHNWRALDPTTDDIAILRLTVPKGTPAAYLGDGLNPNFEDEAELILGRNTAMRVTAVGREEGVFTIDAEVVNG